MCHVVRSSNKWGVILAACRRLSIPYDKLCDLSLMEVYYTVRANANPARAFPPSMDLCIESGAWIRSFARFRFKFDVRYREPFTGV